MTFFLPAEPPDSTPESIQLHRCYNELIQEFTNVYPTKNWDYLYRYFDQHYGIKVDPMYRYTTAQNQVQVSHLNLDLFREKAARQVFQEALLRAFEALESGDLDQSEHILKTTIPGIEWTGVASQFDGLRITVPGAQDEIAEFVGMFDPKADTVELDLDQVQDRLKRFGPDDARDIAHWTAQRLQSMVDQKVSNDIFQAEVDRWLWAIMAAARDPWDPVGILRVWLTEYNLPLQPTQLKSFDHFHETYGWLIDHDHLLTGLDRYYSDRYRKKNRARFIEQADLPAVTSDPEDLPAVTVSTSHSTVTYTQYKNNNGTVVYRRTATRLTWWQTVVQWVRSVIGKNN